MIANDILQFQTILIILYAPIRSVFRVKISYYNVFIKMTNLEFLYIDSNNLTQITNKTFIGLKSIYLYI